jgi:hypothetical protein
VAIGHLSAFLRRVGFHRAERGGHDLDARGAHRIDAQAQQRVEIVGDDRGADIQR